MPRGCNALPRVKERRFSTEKCSPDPRMSAPGHHDKALEPGADPRRGPWDQRLECAVNAPLPALVTAGLFILSSRGLDWRCAPVGRMPPWFLRSGHRLAVNVIKGFHSQQFFLIGFSLAAIAWLPFSSPAEPRWWVRCGQRSACARVDGLRSLRGSRRHRAAPFLFFAAGVPVGCGCFSGALPGPENRDRGSPAHGHAVARLSEGEVRVGFCHEPGPEPPVTEGGGSRIGWRFLPGCVDGPGRCGCRAATCRRRPRAPAARLSMILADWGLRCFCSSWPRPMPAVPELARRRSRVHRHPRL